MGIDYYGVLNLKKNCSDYDIKQSFRSLILQFNPERQKDKSVYDIFCLTAEAYDVLSNKFYRAVYDQYGEEGLKRGIPGPDDYIQPYVYHGDPFRTFREFFGTTSPYADLLDYLWKPLPLYSLPEGKGVKRKEPPLIRPLLLTLNEVFQGGLKKQKIQRRVLIGCDQTTTELREKILCIPIKPGLPPGTVFTFPEEGDQGPTIIPSDVVFITEDIPHDTFRREDNDLIMVTKVNLREALVGTVLIVNTLDNKKLRVPITDIISPDFEKIVEDEGMPFMENPEQRGNLIIKFEIDFPAYLPRTSKNLVNKAWYMASLNGGVGSPERTYQMIMKDKLARIAKKKEEEKQEAK
ncbi:dnaJ homolog subfamily B member 13 [Anabrus simplex]|uniref:dnaJ homolog subfamily B member 13 n=1 Tax=Anabrus simplex TaxID=316456 RepID=UPI0035A35412